MDAIKRVTPTNLTVATLLFAALSSFAGATMAEEAVAESTDEVISIDLGVVPSEDDPIIITLPNP